MGRWGTFVVSRYQPASPETVDEIGYPSGWHRFFASELLAASPDQIAATVGTAPAIFAAVADSDYCALSGVLQGEAAWSWSFGIAPWEDEDTDDDVVAGRARETSILIAEWATRAGLPEADPAAIAETLDRGHGIAEGGLFALLEVLGVAPEAPDPGPAPATLGEPAANRTIMIGNNPRRWISLMFNTTADLYDHLSAVSFWLDQARRSVILPLMASYEPTKVATSIGFNDQIEGAANGLLVHTRGWSTKERIFVRAGDDPGWTRTLRELSKTRFREINLVATAFAPSGHTFGGPGELHVVATLRDQFTTTAVAPLPAEHPGQLKVFANTGLLDRIPSFDAPGIFRLLGQLAVDTFPDGHAFLELERPLHGLEEIVPVSPPAWTFPPGAVEFRPDSVQFHDPPGRRR